MVSPQQLRRDYPDTKSKIVNWVSLIALGIVGIILALLAYWSLQKTEVLQINNAPFPVRTIREHPTAAGVVILNTDYCKKLDVTGRLRISFVSSSREVFLPITDERQEKGCYKSEVPVLIPKDIQPDKYHIHFRVVYSINPLRNQVIEEFDSQEFEVVD